MPRARTARVAAAVAIAVALVAGFAGIASAQVKSWTAAASVPTATSGAASITLAPSQAFPDGGVLVAGGFAGGGALQNVELFDPVTETWTATTSMNVARASFTLTQLDDGTVLAVGGYNGANHTSLASAEIFNPNVSPPTWTSVASLPQAVYDQTATLLADGTVLVAGGYTNPCVGSCASFVSGLAEVYDPNPADPGYGTWTPVGQLNDPRWGATANALTNGTVLIAGGIDATNTATPTAEIYSYTPVTTSTLPSGSFAYNTATSGSSNLNVARAFQTATALNDGDILFAGGQDGNNNSLASSELFDPATQGFTVTGSLSTARDGASATPLADGGVLLAGGENLVAGNGGALSSAEIYVPSTGVWASAGTITGGARLGSIGALLANGWVLVAGGSDSPGGASISTADFYRPPAAPTISAKSRTAGTTLAVDGSGFGIDETVNITFQGSQIETVTADADGAFSSSVTIPATDTVGRSPIRATGASSGIVASVRFRVKA